MTILLFDGEEDAYWWILCLEKIFKEHETPKSLKVLKAVGALRGPAFTWWIWWCRVHPRYNWDTFTTALLWRFKPEWRPILPLDDEEEEPSYESTESFYPTNGYVEENEEENISESSFLKEQSCITVENLKDSSDAYGTQPEESSIFTVAYRFSTKGPVSFAHTTDESLTMKPPNRNKPLTTLPKSPSSKVKFSSPLILSNSPPLESTFKVLHPPQAPPPKPPYSSFDYVNCILPPPPPIKVYSLYESEQFSWYILTRTPSQFILNWIVAEFLCCGESEFQRYTNNLFLIFAHKLFVKISLTPTSVNTTLLQELKTALVHSSSLLKSFHSSITQLRISWCEVHSVVDVNNQRSFMTWNSLNEFDPKHFGVKWRQKFEAQKGDILATKLKNNANKLVKWTAQTILASSDMMKLGYVSWIRPRRYVAILAFVGYKTKDFAAQANLNPTILWGIAKYIVTLCMKLKELNMTLAKSEAKLIHEKITDKSCNCLLLNYPLFSDLSKEFIIKLQRTIHRVLLFSTMMVIHKRSKLLQKVDNKMAVLHTPALGANLGGIFTCLFTMINALSLATLINSFEFIKVVSVMKGKKEKGKATDVSSPVSGEDSDDKQFPSFPSVRFSSRNASSKYDLIVALHQYVKLLQDVCANSKIKLEQVVSCMRYFCGLWHIMITTSEYIFIYLELPSSILMAEIVQTVSGVSRHYLPSQFSIVKDVGVDRIYFMNYSNEFVLLGDVMHLILSYDCYLEGEINGVKVTGTTACSQSTLNQILCKGVKCNFHVWYRGNEKQHE